MATTSGCQRSQFRCQTCDGLREPFGGMSLVLARRMAPEVLQIDRGRRSESSESTTPNPVISVPQSMPKTRIYCKFKSFDCQRCECS